MPASTAPGEPGGLSITQPNTRLRRGVVVGGFESCFFRGPSGARLVRPLPTREARRDDHETLYEIRSVNGQLERHANSERTDDDRGRAVEQSLDVPKVRERPGREPAVSEPTEIRGDQPVAGCRQDLPL